MAHSSSSKYLTLMDMLPPTTKDMGWKPTDCTFKGCISLPQVGTFLCDTAMDLAPLVKEALRLWLQGEKHLPQRLRATYTEVLAVQDALQAAPAEPTRHLAVAWMKQHLQDAALAMLAHIESQARVLTKLADVLEATDNPEQRTSSWATTIVSEESLWLQNSMMAMAHTVGVAMALTFTPDRHMRLAPDQVKARMGAVMLAQHADRQAAYSNTWRSAMFPCSKAYSRLRRCIAPGVYENLPPVCNKQANNICAGMLDVLMRTCTVWLGAALHAPPNRARDGTVMLGAIEWIQVACVFTGRDLELQATLHDSLWCAFCRPDFWDWFMNNTASESWSMLLLERAVDSRHFKGMPLPASKFILDQEQAAHKSANQMARSMMEHYPELRRAEAEYKSMLAAFTASSQLANASPADDGGQQGSRDVVDSGRIFHASDGVSNKEEGNVAVALPCEGEDVPDAVDDTDWNDVQALLRMMYGESGKPVHVQQG